MLLRRTMLACLLSLTMAFVPAVSMAMGHSCAATAKTMAPMPGEQVSTAQAPIVEAAVVKASVVQATQTLDTQASMSMPASCPCNGSMPNCASMVQCQTASGCASHCLGSLGVALATDFQASLGHDHFAIGTNQAVASLAITPPAPPPRA